ncbi:PREDICTED: serine/arginine repetitive matrix protein 1-like isoform X2 [Populus euphratica]|uniref:Serine/arginine repetitive matrix protein 1-like isoform X2 n=1 Tax=Populus euphratica TaxID=75702 RepID=A0AAJ6UMN9_POPEU|nr:PREDICTED: serine/arginine repetitive matrix protein 1-like isoform X2 [Populus euphratica]
MSGGFFRGTSADQDTRFSNKQAKLLKSQKFAPELDHLVDTRKMKMDVIRPWIATRVTELLGFEDEVLINFIYGLLDGKEVNGKEVQISLTGFMEKNTGKFMKELWTLLLSAGKNESGVPQQFLDAKEEETRKKQAEVDRIANEIQKKKEIEKEMRELEREKLKKMDIEVEKKANNAMEPASKHMLPKGSSGHAEDEKETEMRNGARGRKRVSRSPHSTDRSFSSPRHMSRSVSRSPEARRQRSVSSDRMRSLRRRSITPRRRRSPIDSPSPPRRKSSYSRHISRSPLRRRSPSPIRRRMRSPFRRRSPSPLHDRSPSPVRRRRSPSPVRRRRSPSPIKRRRSPSPIRRRRSPSPIRRRRSPFPVRRRSPLPLRRRSPSPVSRRSPSPLRRRSPLSLRRRSPSPVRRGYPRSPSTPCRRSPSPMQHRSSIISRKRSPSPHRRSPSPYTSSSPSPVQHRSPSPVKSPKEHRSPVQSPGERVRSQRKLLPIPRRSSNSLRSPQRDQKDLKDLCSRLPAISPSPERSPLQPESPPVARKSARKDGRSPSPYESPARQRKEQITRDGSSSPQKHRGRKPLKDSPETSKDHEETDHTREGGDYYSRSSWKRPIHPSNINKQKDSPVKVHNKDEQSSERLASRRTTDSRNYPDNMDSRKKDQDIKIGKSSGRGADHDLDAKKSLTLYKDEKDRSCLNSSKDSDKHPKSETAPVTAEKVHHSNGSGALDSGSKESDKQRAEKREKSKHKRSHRLEVASDDDGSYGSEIEERKEAKRRRKEEKKLRKEEKHRRREERRRRREERRAEKLKLKDCGDASSSDDEHVGRRESRPIDDEEIESDQKKLEIELRKKALESLKAKKGINR